MTMMEKNWGKNFIINANAGQDGRAIIIIITFKFKKIYILLMNLSKNLELNSQIIYSTTWAFTYTYRTSKHIPSIIISLLMSLLLGHRPSLWITYKENGP
jgi:hypothetical protein